MKDFQDFKKEKLKMSDFEKIIAKINDDLDHGIKIEKIVLQDKQFLFQYALNLKVLELYHQWLHDA